jgi:hypothetical protein
VRGAISTIKTRSSWLKWAVGIVQNVEDGNKKIEQFGRFSKELESANYAGDQAGLELRTPPETGT